MCLLLVIIGIYIWNKYNGKGVTVFNNSRKVFVKKVVVLLHQKIFQISGT